MSRIRDRGRPEKPRTERRSRGRSARVAVAVAVFALAFALIEVQVLTFEHFALVARENRMRPLVVRAPRGTIYDRHGRVVAENTVGHEVLIMPAPLDSVRAKLDRLRPVLGLTERDMRRALHHYHQSPNLPIPAQRDASPAAVARLEERRPSFSGVVIREYPKRHYPAGAGVGHVVGYVSEISETQLERPEFEGYRQGRWIGQAGLERRYEKHLGGTPGLRYVEVDALGQIKRWLPEEMGVPAVPGRDLQLHLDVDLQRYIAEELFPALETDLNLPNMKAAIVALDPKTGGVLAMHSSPGFDPNLFVGGIDPDTWNALATHPDNPLLDRGTGAAQPPGSTFKPVVAAVGLHLGVVDADTYMPVPCTGGFRYQNRYARCWTVHGRKNLVGAIKHSCNVYFYQLGIRIGFHQFLETGTRLGFAEPTHVDLPAEIAPSFPRDADWWQQRFGYRPNENEIMSLVIGQGAVTLTPVKLAELFVGFARPDGKSPAPRLAKTDSVEERITIDYGIDREQIETLRRGMRRVLEPGGTAHLSRLQHWDFMGKTGTAQNPHGPDHAWFAGIGGPPGEEPEIVAVVLIMHGLHGYVASGPVANVINFYLDRKHGREFERYPTPRERLPRGLHVDWSWLRSPVEDHPTPADTTQGAR